MARRGPHSGILALLGLLACASAAHGPLGADPDEAVLLQRNLKDRDEAARPLGPLAAGQKEGIHEDEPAAAAGLAQASYCGDPRDGGAWRQALPHVLELLAPRSSLHRGTGWSTAAHGDVYSFSVAEDDGMASMKRLFPNRSFVSLTAAAPGKSRLEIWRRGEPAMPGYLAPVELVNMEIPGSFNESLTRALFEGEKMRPAAYLDIDTDSHASAYDVLNWLFANRIARVGTIIGYDDWWAIPCARQHHRQESRGEPRMLGSIPGGDGPPHSAALSSLSSGEGLAHSAIAQQYGVIFRCLAGSCRPPASAASCHRNSSWAPIFVVAGVGAARGDHGFEYTSEQAREWLSAVEC